MEEVLVNLSPQAKTLVNAIDVYKGRVSLQPGDHIAVPIFGFPEVFRPWHHGIYEGEKDDEHWVIHMSGDDKASSTIRRESLQVFCGNSMSIVIVQYTDENGQDDAHGVALRRALKALETPPGEIYDLICNNCEHFATWCRTGRYVLNPDTDNIINILYEKALRRTPNKYTMLFAGKHLNKLQSS